MDDMLATAELDTTPNAITELDGKILPSELEDSTHLSPDPRNRFSVFSELEGSNLDNLIAARAVAEERRLSTTSSLAPASNLNQVEERRLSTASSLAPADHPSQAVTGTGVAEAAPAITSL